MFAALGIRGPWNVPGAEALTVTLRSPRTPADGPLLEPERPGRVVAERGNPFRKEKRNHSKFMLICPQQAHESSMNASSACWRPRHWRERSCPSSADRKWPQPRGHRWNGILKKMRPSVICSFSWSAQGNRCWEGLHWLHRDANQEQIKDKRLLWRSAYFSSTRLQSKNLMLSPFYTHMHREWIRYAKSSSQQSLAFLWKSEMIGASK